MPASPAAPAPDDVLAVSVPVAAKKTGVGRSLLYDLIARGEIVSLQSRHSPFDRNRRNQKIPRRAQKFVTGTATATAEGLPSPTADADSHRDRQPHRRSAFKGRSHDGPARAGLPCPKAGDTQMNATAPARSRQQGCTTQLRVPSPRQECDTMSTQLVRPARHGNGGGNGGECNHAASRIVRRRFANNTIHLTRQCSVCGGQVGQWLKADLYMPETLPWFDEAFSADGVIATS